MTHDETETFRLRDEVDLLALVAVTLGFHPADSLVLVCLDREGRTFQARCDLAPDVGGVRAVVDPLVQAARRNGGDVAFLVSYTDDDRLARVHLRTLARELEADDVGVVARLRVSGGRWYPMTGTRADALARAGVPFDLGSHPLMARSVVRGEVVHGDRRALAATLERVTSDEAAAVAAAYDGLAVLPPGDRSALLSEAEWLHRRLVDDPLTWPPAIVARVLRAVAEPQVRDVALCLVRRSTAAEHVRVWRRVVCLSPPSAVAPAAALLALSAWVAGDGALAWCAVEKSVQAQPGQSLAGLVSQALEHAAPPSLWQPMELADLPLFAG